jgi:citrate lyase synthetase
MMIILHLPFRRRTHILLRGRVFQTAPHLFLSEGGQYILSSATF